jgi:hypothetical protein
MSLKSFIAKVETTQLNEFAPAAPSAPSAPGAPVTPRVGQKVIVKPGAPAKTGTTAPAANTAVPGTPSAPGSTQPQSQITNQAGKVIAQANTADAKKLGDLVNAGNVTMMDPTTGEPLEEAGEESQTYRDAKALQRAAGINASADDAEERMKARREEPKTAFQHASKTFMKHAKDPLGLNESVMTASKLEDILSNYPHEHKMAQEGWGMDASLAEALTDHYFKEGRIPRAVWNASSEELRKHVEECYTQDVQQMQEGIEDRIGATPAPINRNPVTQNPVTTPAFVRKQQTAGAPVAAPKMTPKVAPVDKQASPSQPVQDELEEASPLETMLRQATKESTMYESKKLKGGQAKLDANKNGKLEKSDFKALRAKKVDEATTKTKTGVKHTADDGGYGRKDDDASTGGDKSFDSSELNSVFGGKKPAKEIGKLSVKKRIKTKADSEEVDESFTKWDAQLKTLLEGKQIVKEGLSVSTSVGQEGAPDTVSITASDEDAHQLLALLNNAGMGSGVPSHSVKTDPMADLMKAHADSEGGSFSTAGTEEPGDIEVTDFDGAQDEISGKEDDGMDAMKQMLAAMGIGSDAAPEPKHNEFDAGSDSEEGDEESGEESSGEEGEDDTEVVVGEEWSDDEADEDYDSDGEVESEKEEHEGAVGNAIEDSEDSDDEDKEEHKCDSCGGELNEGHDCGTQLNEWANSPQGQSEDEEFTATIDYFTKTIAGGLNGQKRDQTVLPHTSVKVSEGYNIDVAAEMRKLAGIR